MGSDSALIVCEYTATIRDAMRARGIDAWSNDILETEGDPRWHLQMDCRDAIMWRDWALIIMCLPCTAMAVCGNRHYAGTADRTEAIEWSLATWYLATAVCDRVALENPASVIFPHLRKAGATVQYIQPWQFGHLEQKKTGLALRGLPPLEPTYDVYDAMMTLPKAERERVFHMPPSDRRGLERSRFYDGVASAMADQWGALL